MLLYYLPELGSAFNGRISMSILGFDLLGLLAGTLTWALVV